MGSVMDFAEVEQVTSLVLGGLSGEADGTGLQWAAEAWQALAGSGLTVRRSDMDRVRCLLRAAALGAVYRDFCAIAFDDGSMDDWRDDEIIDYLGGSLPVKPAIVRRLAASLGIDVEYEDFSFDVPEDILEQLVEDQYFAVGGALRSIWGDRVLFASLFRAAEGWETVLPASEAEIDELIGEEVSGEKEIVWGWLVKCFPQP